jgi:hypothetical protein
MRCAYCKSKIHKVGLNRYTKWGYMGNRPGEEVIEVCENCGARLDKSGEVDNMQARAQEVAEEHALKETEGLIESFVWQMEMGYPGVRLEYLYNNSEEQWYIWSTTDINLQYDKVFQGYVGKLIRALFYDRGIFNIAFGYKEVHIE